MQTRLYSVSLSPPGVAAHLMLDHKGVEHSVINLLPAVHAIVLRGLGFGGSRVPALKINREKVQGSRIISQYLEQLYPEPPLFPADPIDRAAVEAAEEWGELVFQPVPRQIFRWLAANSQTVRRWLADEVIGMPAPGPMAVLQQPIAAVMSHVDGANEAALRTHLTTIPEHLDHVDSLIADGAIGQAEPNAADFQIATTVRLLLNFTDLRALQQPRPAVDLALRLVPDFPGPIPAGLPSRLSDLLSSD